MESAKSLTRLIRSQCSLLSALLAAAVVAVSVAWWLDHRQLQEQVASELSPARRKFLEDASVELERLSSETDRLRANLAGVESDNNRLTQALSDVWARVDKFEDQRGFIRMQPSGETPVKFEIGDVPMKFK